MKKYELEDTQDNIKGTIDANILERNYKIINLMKLLNSMKENHIISIDGPWGCGKTFFIKQMMYIKENYNEFSFLEDRERELTKEFDEKYIVVYYNAWENDDHINPLDSIIYTILNILPKYNETFINGGELFDLIKKCLMNFIEISSIGIIKSDDIKEMKKYEDLADSVNTIEEKKNALDKLIKAITKNKRLLLIVDELDRCKPDYAIKTIETIKHFYNNDTISTIVVTNNNQLSKTIKKFYGAEFDGYGYLNKIYDAIITLGSDKIEQYCKRYLKICNQTWLPEDVTIFLFKYFNFSYRECNRYMCIYKMLESYVNYKNQFNPNENLDISCVFLPLTIALKIKDIYLYEKFVEKKGYEILKDIFNEKLKEEDSRLYNWLEEIFHVGDEENLIKRVTNRYNEMFGKQNEHNYFKYPYMEAISMLGSLINVDD